MELQAVTGQLYIVDGEAKKGTAVPGLLAQSAPSGAARGRESDSLFIHLSLTGRPEETATLAQDLLDAIGNRFYQATGSVTAALRRAIIEANELLLRLNLSNSGVSREGAITCAVLRKDELFMLQAGEALALLGHNFGVERLPPKMPERVMPMGRSAGIDIRYFHHRLQPGDMLLLADPRVAHLPAQTFASALVDTEVEVGLVKLKSIVDSEPARLLLVEFTEEMPSDLPEVSQPTRRSEQPLATVPEPKPRRQPETTATVAHPPPSAATTATRPIPAVDVERTARQATSQAAMGLSRFTGWLADLLDRLRPPQEEAAPPTNWTVTALLAVFIPLIVAVVVTGVYIQRGRVRRFAEIKAEMGQNIGLAEQAGDDTAVARQHYDTVVNLANEAEELRLGDEEVDRLRRQALTQLDRLDDVTRLNAELFYEYPETADLAAVVLREGFNGGLYTLDKGTGRVYQHQTDETYLNPTSEEAEQVIFSGEAVGSHVADEIVDIVWRPSGRAVSREGLAALDVSGTLFTFYPNFADKRAVPLGLASEWQLPVAMTTFDERLYVLDVGARAIWKYFPEGDGFLVRENERAVVFSQNPDLEDAVDFDIYSEDGSLIVLYGDGRIRYYDTRSGRIQWDENQLLQNGLNTPLVTPTTVELVGRGLNASIFVADPGSNRIVQISRGGIVLAQYRASDDEGRELFSQISDFAIAEAPLRMFVTAGNSLFVATQE